MDQKIKPAEVKKIKKRYLLGIGLLMSAFYFICTSGEKEKKLVAAEPKVDAVVNSEYDASVKQVKYFIKTLVKDPSSYEPIQWGVVIKHHDGDIKEVRRTIREANYYTSPGDTSASNVEFVQEKGVKIYVTKDSLGFVQSRMTLKKLKMNHWFKVSDTEIVNEATPMYSTWHTFRSKNSFGAVVPSKIVCDLDADGNILTYEIQE